MTNLNNSSQEAWKDIKGYEGLYLISNTGKIKSLFHIISMKNGVKRAICERLMKFSKSGSGYYQVKLSKEGFVDNLLIHLLVWDHFGNSRRDKFKIQVDHINGDKLNNDIMNLQTLSVRDHVAKSKLGSKLTGAHFTGKTWRARIWINGKNRHIGKFKTMELAAEAYQIAKINL